MSINLKFKKKRKEVNIRSRPLKSINLESDKNKKLPPTSAEHRWHHGTNIIAQYVLNKQSLFSRREKFVVQLKQ